jgi:methylmalonyl-CoA mutase N-terminal domain/subunit
VEEPPLEDFTSIDQEAEKSQKERLQRLKEERDQDKVTEELISVKRAAEGDGNLVYPILNAVRASATVGEITDTLRAVFGEYRENT